MGRSSEGRMGSPFSRFDELCGCVDVCAGAVECPFMGGWSEYLTYSLSPCLQVLGLVHILLRNGLSIL